MCAIVLWLALHGTGASAQSSVQIVGTYTYSLSFTTQTATLHVDKLLNNSPTYTTGTLRLELWATTTPWASATVGYRIAKYQIGGSSNGTLGPNQYFAPVNATVPIDVVPPQGSYYATLVVTEFYSSGCSSSDKFCTDTYGSFPNQLVIGGSSGTVPVCTLSVSPGSLSSSGGNVSVAATCTNQPTSYHWSVNGAAVNATSAAWTYAAPANTSAVSRTDTISLVASNAAGAGAAVSQGVTIAGVTASGAGPVNANQHGITGSWFNPLTGGQGIEMEVYPDISVLGQGVVFGGWFTYDVTAAGGQRWYAMQGAVSSTNPVTSLTIATGYGGNFAALPPVNAVLVGNATLQFSDCNNATLHYTFTDGSGRSGAIPLQRLTANVTCAATGDNGSLPFDYLLSGNWFDSRSGGQGLIFDVNPAQNILFGAWYTFAPNGQQIGGPSSQRWYVMQAQYTGGTAPLTNIPIAIGTGGVFDRSDPTQTVQVGTASITFQSCSAITLSYTFTGGSNKGLTGSVNLSRVGPTPAGCAIGAGATATPAITAVSSQAPTALTPLTLNTKGLDTTSPFTVSVAFPNGTRLPVTPIRTANDGTVVLATPLYVDPATGMTSGANVKVQIAQGGRLSNSVSLTIKDLPSAASYGATRGQISHAFLNYMTISLAKALNHLQAVQAIPSNHTDTSAAQAQIIKQLQDTIEMRNNVDIISTGSQPSLGVGTTSHGNPIQFDANSVDMLDRMIAMHLQAIGYFPNLSFQESVTQIPQGADAEPPRSVQYDHHADEIAGSGGTAAGPPVHDLTDLIDLLGKAGGTTGLVNGIIGAATPESGTTTTADRILAGVGGAASIVAVASSTPEIVTGAVIVGAAVGTYTVARDVQNAWESEQGLSQLLTAKGGAKLAADVIGTAAGIFGAKAVGSGLAFDVSNALQLAGESGGSGLVIQGAGYLSNLAAGTIGAIDLGEAAESESASASPPQHFGFFDGAAIVTNSQGPVLSSLAGVIADGEYWGVADDSGDYSIEMPIGVAGIDYRHTTIQTFDPITLASTGSTSVVDLSGLNPDTPVHVPTVFGSCIDADAGDPDGDDPDCD